MLHYFAPMAIYLESGHQRALQLVIKWSTSLRGVILSGLLNPQTNNINRADWIVLNLEINFHYISAHVKTVQRRSAQVVISNGLKHLNPWTLKWG